MPRSKARLKGRADKAPKHVRLHHWLLRTEAYRSLGLAARCLLVELYDLYNGSNNGELFLSIRDAAKRLGVNKDTAQKAVRELEDRGFIRARERGMFTTKQATTWILTEFAFGNQLPTKEFMRWRPTDSGTEKQNIVPPNGTNGPSERDQDSRNQRKNSPNGPTQRDRGEKIRPSLVPLTGTQLVNQGRGEQSSATDLPEIPAFLDRRHEWRKITN